MTHSAFSCQPAVSWGSCRPRRLGRASAPLSWNKRSMVLFQDGLPRRGTPRPILKQEWNGVVATCQASSRGRPPTPAFSTGSTSTVRDGSSRLPASPIWGTSQAVRHALMRNTHASEAGSAVAFPRRRCEGAAVERCQPSTAVRVHEDSGET